MIGFSLYSALRIAVFPASFFPTRQVISVTSNSPESTIDLNSRRWTFLSFIHCSQSPDKSPREIVRSGRATAKQKAMGFKAAAAISGYPFAFRWHSFTTRARATWRFPMEWLKSKATIVVLGLLALIGLQGYGMLEMRKSVEDRMTSTEGDLRSSIESSDAKLSKLTSDFDVVTKRLGITTEELEQAQASAKQLKQENAQMARRLRKELSTKADSKTVLKLHEESNTKLTAVQQEAANR